METLRKTLELDARVAIAQKVLAHNLLPSPFMMKSLTGIKSSGKPELIYVVLGRTFDCWRGYAYVAFQKKTTAMRLDAKA